MTYMIRIDDVTPDRATITAVDVEPQALCWETGHVSGLSSYELDSGGPNLARPGVEGLAGHAIRQALPECGVTPPPWSITDSAVARYAHARGWHVGGDYHSISEDIRDRCEDGLADASKVASYRARDQYGRELWRTPKRTGGGLRIVIDPREGPTAAIIWCGYGAQPSRVFAP